MEYTTEFDKKKGICTIHVTGRHKRPEDSRILQKLQRDITEQQGYQRFLVDMTKAEIITSTMGTFDTATVSGDPERKQTRQKIALLYTDHRSDHRFLENVSVNRGYQLRIFYQMDMALEWLTPKDENT